LKMAAEWYQQHARGAGAESLRMLTLRQIAESLELQGELCR
jgi:hypothetical protein